MSKNSKGNISSISKYGLFQDDQVEYTGCISLDNLTGSRRDTQYADNLNPKTLKIDVSHTHTFTPSGSISITSNPTFTGSGGTTSSVGNGASFSIMPPYVIKYCWERTA